MQNDSRKVIAIMLIGVAGLGVLALALSKKKNNVTTVAPAYDFASELDLVDEGDGNIDDDSEEDCIFPNSMLEEFPNYNIVTNWEKIDPNWADESGYTAQTS